MKVNAKHINVFIAYARKDTSYLDNLRIYLKPLHRNKTIKIWYDGEITPGDVWEKQIKKNLHQADIILLLVSANSLASDYFYEKEMTDALERHEANKAIVIPVILSDCIWELTNLAELQALPKNGKPIDDWQKESSAYTDIVRGLNRGIQVIHEKEKNRVIEEENAQKELLKRQEDQRKKEAALKEKARQKAIKKAQEEENTQKELLKKQEEQRNIEAAKKEKAQQEAERKAIQRIIGNMVTVNGGTFQMGDRKSLNAPIHTVYLSTFHISKYQVTQEQWRAVMGGNPSYFKGCGECPVEKVSWDDIQTFIKKLNSLTGKQFRLPTESEWEFAARGGIKSKGYKYAGGNTLKNVAWYGKNSNSKTHFVGQKKSNELGLYDMSGNVWEWCSDWYDENYYTISPSNNPKGSSSGLYRVLRGGSWDYIYEDCKVSFRFCTNSNYRSNDLGFRVAEN